MRQLITHCKRGHEYTEENTYVHPDGTRSCRACRKAVNDKTLAERKSDPSHQQNLRDGRARWRDRNPTYHKFHALLVDYKITPERYQQMIDEQDGKCAVCLRPLPEVVHLDHDHACCDRNRKTCGNCVRGLLCGTCNQGLGQFKDDEERLLRAVEYLRKYRQND